MNPTQIKQARNTLRLTQRALEQALGLKGCDGRTVRRWESGKIAITGPCKKLIEIFLEHGLDVDQFGEEVGYLSHEDRMKAQRALNMARSKAIYTLEKVR